MRMATCHPSQRHAAHGLCKQCYRVWSETKNPSLLLPHPCECGCGNIISDIRRFVQGHKSPAHKEKLSRHITFLNKQKEWTPEERKKVGDRMRGRKRIVKDDGLYRQRLSASLKEYYKNHDHYKKGKPHTPEHRAKIAAALKGQSLSEERKRRISISHKKRWIGKTTKRGYPLEKWIMAREIARAPDGRVCILDAAHRFVRYKNPDVHHIDGDKQNCAQGNLVCLCKKCHASMQSNLTDSIPRLHAILSTRYGYTYDGT